VKKDLKKSAMGSLTKLMKNVENKTSARKRTKILTVLKRTWFTLPILLKDSKSCVFVQTILNFMFILDM